MSPTRTNILTEQLAGLKRVHSELEEAIDETLQPVWQLNDGLLTWLSLLSKSHDNYAELANQFMAVSVWLERKLFSKRTKSLCSKGVFKELTLLEKAIEEHAKDYVRSDVASQKVMLSASLSVIELASGPANVDLVDFGNKVDRLIEQDLTPLHVELIFPERLIPSIAAVVAYVEGKIVADGKNSFQPVAKAEPGEPIDPIDAEFSLPDLDEF
ncbi:MAG: hypothetical protein GWQ05_25780 [Verrucomicrobiaceae bacterium]|jgi:hypothetical protein|nr:hypothetical protein [Verrucomicrobiales bacterium]MDF1785850.1 hypothetical protein [Verrucomicrobiales bacterium]NCF94341.1 hypothetical protein [Verrucomicrobiaceae bacterium]